MKKYFTLLLVAIFSLVIVSCDDRDEVVGDGTTYSKMTDITGSFTDSNSYEISQGLVNTESTDVVLVYRQSGISNGNPVWQQIPRTLFLPEGELDYDFDFTKNDVLIKAGGNIVFSLQNNAFRDAYLNNQRFRIVLVPASQGKNANVDYSDYNAVIKYYNIKDQK